MADPAPELPPRAARVVRAAFWGSAALALLFHLGAGLDLRHALLLPVLLLLLPAVGMAQAPLVGELEARDRISLYVVSGITILVLGALGAVAGLPGPGAEAMGLVFPSTGELVLGTAALTAAAGGILLLFHVGARIGGYDEPPYLDLLLPRTGSEKAGFVLLSVAAGVGEEAAYRAYALTAVVATGLSPGAAVLLTSVAFGLLHGYQGAVGVARTASLGAVFGISLVRWETVVPAMIAHTLVDWIVGLWLGRRLLRR